MRPCGGEFESDVEVRTGATGSSWGMHRRSALCARHATSRDKRQGQLVGRESPGEKAPGHKSVGHTWEGSVWGDSSKRDQEGQLGPGDMAKSVDLFLLYAAGGAPSTSQLFNMCLSDWPC